MSNDVRITVEGKDPAAVRSVVSTLSLLLVDGDVIIEDSEGREIEQGEYAVLAQEAAQEAGEDEALNIEDIRITLVEHITFEG